ncbi:Lrp/AsnC family transcriptional regulator [Candidatus Woesearchaeota archaeon]|nr:Lrp/AsnC family transcriptional regulator [Candidatus Woesearchaeota archaeon]
MVDLDLKDRKLLYELDCNSRQTIQQLAKKIGLSKDAIKYRINRLFKDEIIKSFNAVIDTGKLGFTSFRFFIKFYQLSPEKEKEILAFLQKNKNLVWFVQVEGNWDINTWFLYKSLEEMNSFWTELLTKYNNFIERREFGIYSNVTYFSRAYLLKSEKNIFSMPVISLPKEEKIDKSDLKIIELLSKNARMSIVDISQETGLTPKTIINKIKRLEKEKIIVGYRAEFNIEKLGLKYYKIHITTFNTTSEKIKQLKQYIQQNPNIIYHDEVLGGYDIEIEIQIENEHKLRELIENIRERFSDIIKDYEVLHYYKEHRLRFFPSL